MEVEIGGEYMIDELIDFPDRPELLPASTMAYIGGLCI